MHAPWFCLLKPTPLDFCVAVKIYTCCNQSSLAWRAHKILSAISTGASICRTYACPKHLITPPLSILGQAAFELPQKAEASFRCAHSGVFLRNTGYLKTRLDTKLAPQCTSVACNSAWRDSWQEPFASARLIPRLLSKMGSMRGLPDCLPDSAESVSLTKTAICKSGLMIPIKHLPETFYCINSEWLARFCQCLS